MELTDAQFRTLTPDAKTSMIYGLIVGIEHLKVDVSILRRELKDLRENQNTLARAVHNKKRKETKRAASQTI